MRPWGMYVCLIKNVLYVMYGMCGSTPWGNMPISLFVIMIQYYILGPTMRWKYSSEALVSV